MTVSVLKVTVHLASQSGPIPIIVCLKQGITWPVNGKLEGRCGWFRVAMPEECWVFPMAVPTVIGVYVRVKSVVGASGGKYISLATNSAIPVFLLRTLVLSLGTLAIESTIFVLLSQTVVLLLGRQHRMTLVFGVDLQLAVVGK